MNPFKRIWRYFKFKKSLIDSLAILEHIQEKKLFKALDSIIELEQGKVYFLCAEDVKQEEAGLIREILNQVQKKMDWTMPEVIICNRPIEELNLEEMEMILQKFKEVKHDKAIQKKANSH